MKLQVIEGKPWAGEHPDHCLFGEVSDPAQPECLDRAVYHVDGWGGPQGCDLCTTHHDQLLAVGILTRPGYRYTESELAANAADAEAEYWYIHRALARSAPTPNRAHLRAVPDTI